ncbi:hypothetical protein [Mucilaginibacter sp.]|uniref:hypothetical protein n=1 Tax=Mucilaginibacter sp. TaxID=1882438 RepID=UPI002613A742|nr:hypothetical protein [Mucilaginibacter sp.]MDB4918189.1 hypothetical protein [Mucilaginibacter sp.]
MMYYFLSVSTKEDEIGCYHQTTGLPEGYTSKWYDEPNSMTNLTDSSLPDFVPDLIWELKDDAILTDIISAGNITATGFLMSEKAKAIFERFNLIEHKFHKASLIVKDQTLAYYYLQLVNMDFTEINFNKSSFCIGNVFRMKENDINILSSHDLIEKQKKLELGHIIYAEKLSVNETFKALDLFFFSIIHDDIFVSQNLLNELIENNITGYDVTIQNIFEI